MSFVPEYSKWIRDRMEYIPRETAALCGDLAGQVMLDVGCGDMLADLGLLSLGIRHISGVDVLNRAWDVKEYAAAETAKAGFIVPPDYSSRLSYTRYDGSRLPFHDNQFDFVMSWGVFEHIADVPAVLREIRRVVKPAGQVLVVVHPWFPAYTGSHLSDYIEEPFFQLTRTNDWVYAQLESYLARNPEQAKQRLGFLGPGGCTMREFLLGHMWGEYCTLNGYSARMFLAEVMKAGFVVERLQCHMNEPYIERAPSCADLTDVIATGTTVVLRPAKKSNPTQPPAETPRPLPAASD